MDYSEKWGKDVDEAVRLAMEDLNVTEEQVTAGLVMVTVLEEPTKGFLGIGSKLAKVRVEKIHIDEEEAARDLDESDYKAIKKGTRDLRKKNKPQQTFGGRNDGQGRGGRPERSDRSRRPDREDRSERSERSERPDRGDRWDRSDRSDRPARGGRPRPERPFHEDRPRSEERFHQRESGRPNIAEEKAFPDKPILSEKPENLVPEAENEASIFLKDIMGKMGLDVNVNAFRNEECMYLEVIGTDSRTVIGKRGQTLDAIQYLTNLVTNKDKEEYQRVIIDVEGYRSRREKTLERLAVKLAKKVQKSGRSVRLEPMNPYERKVIHSTLQAMDGVTTRSEGEEPYRRVIIDRSGRSEYR